MKRRSFIKSMLRAGVAAMVLPSATTFARTWKQTEESNPWVIEWGSISECNYVIPSPEELAQIFNEAVTYGCYTSPHFVPGYGSFMGLTKSTAIPTNRINGLVECSEP